MQESQRIKKSASYCGEADFCLDGLCNDDTFRPPTEAATILYSRSVITKDEIPLKAGIFHRHTRQNANRALCQACLELVPPSSAAWGCVWCPLPAREDAKCDATTGRARVRYEPEMTQPTHCPNGHAASPPAQMAGSAWLRMRSRIRLRGAIVAAVCWSMVITGLAISPSSSGYGTHRRLGLPQCSFLARTGYPCPSCGLTTSVSLTLHGRLLDALRAQPLGVLLTAGAILAGMTGLIEAAGRDVFGRIRLRWWWFAVAVGIALACWGLTIQMGLADGRYPAF